MSEKFDPYHRWLAIPPREQPPNLYRLLGLTKFESDVDVIDGAADRQMAHVRTHQSGKYAAESQKLLNEISAARLVLLDPQEKSAYDAVLREREGEMPMKKAAPLLPAQPLNSPPMAPRNAPAEDQTVANKPLAAFDTPAIAPSRIPLYAGAGAAALVLFLSTVVGGWLYLGGDAEKPSVAIVTPVVPPDLDRKDPAPVVPVVPPVQPVVIDPIDPTPGNEIDNETPPVEPVRPSPPIVDEPIDAPSDPVEETSSDPIDEATPEEPAENEEPPASPIAALFAAAEAETRAAIPAAAALNEKKEQIEGLFSVSAARTQAQREETAEKLLATARDTENDPAAQYVLLETARNVASAGGHLELALDAADELDAAFQVDGLALRAASLAQAADAPTPLTAKAELVDPGIEVIDELFAADQFVEAAKLIKALQGVAAKTRDKEQRALLIARQEQGSELFKGFKAAQGAIETLKKSPDDPAAALVAGRYYAFVKGDWERGIVMLSASSDDSFKKLSQQELNAPTEAAQQKSLADAWLAMAGKAKGVEADRQRARAAMWYEAAQDGLVGLAKIEVQRKIQSLGKIEFDGGAPLVAHGATVARSSSLGKNRTVDLLELIDMQQDSVRGDWKLVDGKLATPASSQGESLLRIPYLPPAEYDLDVTLSGKELGFDLFIGLVRRGRPFVVFHEGQGYRTSGIWSESSTNIDGQFLRIDRLNRIRYAVRDEGVVVTVNGEPIIEWQGDPAALPVAPLARSAGDEKPAMYLRQFQRKWVVESIKLTPITGQGAPLRQASSTATAMPTGKRIDLLPLVDVASGQNSGWRRDDAGVLSPRGPFSRVAVRLTPPEEYLLEMEVTRREGSGEFCVGLVYQGKQCHVAFDRNLNTVTDLMVDMSTNSDGVMRHRGEALPLGKRHKISCKVLRDELSASVDGKTLIHWRGDATWKGMNDFWTVSDKSWLMVGAFLSEFQIHSFNLQPLNDSAAPESHRSSEIIDLISRFDRQRDSVVGFFHINGSALRVPRLAERGRIQLPVEAPASYDLDLDLTPAGGGNPLCLGIVYQGKQCLVAIDQDKARFSRIVGRSESGDKVVLEVEQPDVLAANTLSKIKCAVRPRSITVSVNGREILSYKGDSTWLGMPTDWEVPNKNALMIGAHWGEFNVEKFTLTPQP